MNVFTYGTLMFPQIWERVTGRPATAVRGRVTGFSIYRVEDAEFPGIIAAAAADGEAVEGVLYLDVDAASLAPLDAFENDFYRREVVLVDCDDGRRREGEAYVVPEDRRAVLTSEVWQADAFVAQGGLDRFAAHFAGFRRAEGV